ncbi:MAG: dihydrodipicolinate synthase family protein [Rhodospirillaceae bacterium]|jgi:4-hydroxy-tetrahydrodipicolinate synthase|nr:dihydrodipicolinate synthase family protein [Rhodospirillaceae bacterium]MBT3911069.1 dihydrodipicolinate synthase family protein [Rhodospirillaceae bacterium]MBT5297268.1 dihydrodipicolinate synthase family protein [Rhodospirillaceae bacterium]MBT5514317.1 dihydrodipicolinate synthase family protein [Rhodospirillaceae bacterium]MBT6085172.1 dihydrodipicolinate synthase family protein [Rhodospirillaceae bacterium]
MSTRLTEDARGVYVIAATPFAENGAVDFPSIDRLVEFYIGEGVHGMTVLGIMGEAPKLTDSEQTAVLARYLKRIDGRVPVIVGVSNPGIDNLAALSKASMDAGAAGVMVAGMPGLKTDEQVLGYFDNVMGKIDADTPVCLQDYPPTTTVHMSVGNVNQLITDHPRIVMFKHEDCPGHRKLTRIRRAPETDGVRRVSILTGNGALYVPQELARGADGLMTGFAFPGMLVDVYENYAAGIEQAGEDLFDCYLPIVRHEQQIGMGLAIRKEILRRRSALVCAAARAPGPSLDADDMAELDGLLGRLKDKLQATGAPVPNGI